MLLDVDEVVVEVLVEAVVVLEVVVVMVVDEDPEPEAQLPTGGPVFVEVWSTSGPGLGNMRSTISVVAHPFPTLATNMAGRWLIGVEGVPLPAVTVMAAQFMYISRLPILLNHDHAKRASPAGVSTGNVKSKDPDGEMGQFPIYDMMTVHVLPLSKEREAWQLPPP